MSDYGVRHDHDLVLPPIQGNHYSHGGLVDVPTTARYGESSSPAEARRMLGRARDCLWSTQRHGLNIRDTRRTWMISSGRVSLYPCSQDCIIQRRIQDA